MINLRIYPQNGTIEDSKSLKFEITDINVSNYRINIENATHGIKADIIQENTTDKGSYIGIVNLNIPEQSSQSAISVFAHIDEKQEDGSYRTVKICPSIFNIKVGEKEDSFKDLYLSSSYVSYNDLCSISVVSDANEKIIFSINDKVFKVITNDKGIGSINFKASSIIDESSKISVQKIPIYFYNKKDNYVHKKVSGLDLNILPEVISLHADPRCDINDDSYNYDPWIRPEECDDTIDPPVLPPAIPPVNPPICLPLNEETGSGAVSLKADLSANVCRIYHSSATLLNNGMILYAYLSPEIKPVTDGTLDATDSRYNINRVHIAKHNSSISNQVKSNIDVIIAPKSVTEDFLVHITEELWNVLGDLDDSDSSDLHILFYSKLIGYQCVKLIDRYIDEYTGSYVITGEAGNTNVLISDWLYCVNSVIYHGSESPSLYTATNPATDTDNYYVDWIQDDDNNYLQVVDVSISSNSKYVGAEEETYVYLIAEAIVLDKSQLFFFSFSLGKDSTFNMEDLTKWEQLTFDGNNKNPRAYTDSNNNLHVTWESDRGDISQIYYGVLGPYYKSFSAVVFSSFIDKYSEFLTKIEKPFDYLDASILEPIDESEYISVPEYDTESLIDGGWIVDSGGGGSVEQFDSFNYLNNLSIRANAVTQDAIAFVPLQILLDNDNPSYLDLLQFNYQINFDLQATVFQNSSLVSDPQWSGIIIDDKEIDKLYDEWKNEFTVSIENNVFNEPIYTKDGSQYIIGRSDNIFDRIVPLCGAYKALLNSPSISDFQIKILKNDNNLNDFSFGVMFEKSYFRATNIDNLLEEEHFIYTGRAKIVVFIKTEDTSETRASYIIVKEFPEILDMNELANYKILINYTKISSGEVENLLDTYQTSYSDKFIGTITLLINNVVKFSQSFISVLSDNYNFFDIGFGIPFGGYYIADKMHPHKLGVFDDIDVLFDISNILITSPTYAYNNDIISIPSEVNKVRSLRVFEEEGIIAPDGTIPYSYPSSYDNELISLNYETQDKIIYYAQKSDTNDFSTSYDVSSIDKISVEFTTYALADKIVIESSGETLYDSGFVSASASSPNKFDIDVSLINDINVNAIVGPSDSSWEYIIYFKTVRQDNGFSQVPITIEGINQSAAIDMGICDDMHLTWQSNRDKNWNIFYTNSTEKLNPFRYDSRITNTEGNSLSPSVSVNRNGYRMITWHDNRNGSYDIYAARSIEGYSCNEDKCKKKMVKSFDGDDIVECSLLIDYDIVAIGTYALSLEFYSDVVLTDLYKTIVLDEINYTRWFINSSVINNILSYDNSGNINGVVLSNIGTISVSYIPDKDDNIFDKVLHVKLIVEEVEE